MLAASQRVLQRWQKDLDREHLDEGDEGAHLSEVRPGRKQEGEGGEGLQDGGQFLGL